MGCERGNNSGVTFNLLLLFPKTNIVYFNNSFTAKVAKDAEIS